MPKRAPIFRPLGRSREQQQASLRQVADQRRGSSTARGYGADWQRLRARFLAAHPLCECDDCKGGELRVTPAEVVDHIEAIEDRPELRLVESNLRAMSKTCHDRHTARTRGFGRKGSTATVFHDKRE